MGQVTIYMDDDTLKRMRDAATAAGLSMSAWLADLVRERTRTQWPASVIELVGAWDEFPEVEQLRTGYAEDTARETF